MTNIKDTLGKKIRSLREEKHMTREFFCNDETELTVRQLKRIEGGESLPTIPKLSFIAKQLEIKISELIDEDQLALPQEYLNLKKKLMRFYSYGDENRRAQRDLMFDEIHEKFYEKLPEEEQLSIDIQQASADVKITNNIDFGNGLLSEYLFQVKNKTHYSENDLLLIYLYFNCYFYKPENPDIYEKLLKNVLISIDTSANSELFIISRILITAIEINIQDEKYEKIIDFTKILRNIMDNTLDYNRKPVIDMLDGMYTLFVLKQEKKAEEIYSKAAVLAKLSGDNLLSNNISREWLLDKAKYDQSTN